MSNLMAIVVSLVILSGCSSTTAKLTKSDATTDNRIIYGKIVDLNPDSDPNALQITYTLNEQRPNTMLSADNKYPRLEPKSPYFWIPVPKDATFIGINSIRFKIKNIDGEAIIRDDKTYKPLFGVNLTPGNNPVYIGDITIRSGTKKYTAVHAETFDLKEAYIKNDGKSAKEFMDKNGFNSSELAIVPFKLKTYQEARNTKSRSNQL